MHKQANSQTGLRAAEIMTRKLITLSPEMDVFEAIQVLVRNRITGAPVISADQEYLGIFSEKCCMQVLVDAAYDQLPSSCVEAYMDRNATTVTEETDLLTITQIFLNTSRRRLPVLRGKEIVGQISRRDVLQAALKIISAHPTNEARLLYLSALRSSSEALIT